MKITETSNIKIENYSNIFGYTSTLTKQKLLNININTRKRETL